MALTYGKVTGKFAAVIGDSTTDADDEPDIVPLTGTVTFTVAATSILSPDAPEGPTTYMPIPIVAKLDEDGYLSHNGKRGVSLVASNGETNPSGFTYSVRFDLKYGTISIPYNAFNFRLPAGQVIDLTTVAPVPSSTGVAISQGVGISKVSTDRGQFVFRMTNGTETRVDIPVAPGGGAAFSATNDDDGSYTINDFNIKGLTPKGELPSKVKSDIANLLSAKADVAHTHTTADVAGLDSALTGKAATSHTHAWVDITAKPTTFSPAAHEHSAADINAGTLDPARLPVATTTAAGAMSAGDKTKLDSLSSTGGTPATPSAASSTASLAALLALPRYKDRVTDDEPTAFTVSTADDMGTAGVVVPYTGATQPAGRQVASLGRMDEGLAPMEFLFNGSEFQIRFQAQNWDAMVTQVWVDNRPLTAAPVETPMITPPNTVGYIHVKWPTSRVRRVRVMNRGGSIQEMRVGDKTNQVLGVSDTPLLGVVADSFGGATNYSNAYQVFPEWMSRFLNANIMLSSVGGSGYLSGGQLNQKFGDGARRYLIRTKNLDALAFFGSINDTFQETEEVTRAAYRDTWTSYADENPTMPIVVFGVQPSGAETTVGMPVHRNNRLMYLEAMAHPRVVGFVDMLGTAKGDGTAPTPWDAEASYADGAIVAYRGAIYRATAEGESPFTNATPPVRSSYWKQISWVFNGTGNAGNVANDGNRDYLIGDDNTHPTPTAGYVFGSLMSSAMLRVLSSPSKFTYFNV